MRIAKDPIKIWIDVAIPDRPFSKAEWQGQKTDGKVSKKGFMIFEETVSEVKNAHCLQTL